MPTISPISITPHALAAGQGLSTPSAVPSPTIVSSEALDALLHSPPDPAREAKKPDDKVQPGDRSTLEQGLADLKSTDNSTVKRALCDPNANSSIAFISKLNTVFTKENVDTFLRSPQTQDHTTALNEIGTHLNTDTINAVLSPLEAGQIENYRKCVDSALFGLKYQLFSAPVGERFDLVRRFAGNKQGALTDIENRLGAWGPPQQTSSTLPPRSKELTNHFNTRTQMTGTDVATSRIARRQPISTATKTPESPASTLRAKSGTLYMAEPSWTFQAYASNSTKSCSGSTNCPERVAKCN